MAKFVELVLAALQFQTEGALTIAELLLASPESIRKRFYRIPTHERQWFSTNWAEAYRNRQQFYKRLHYLKHEGLVIKRSGKDAMQWMLTRRGKERLREYRQSRTDLFSSAHIHFPKPEGDGVAIVAFDIPEKERRKRDWIRQCLVEMDFEPLQKSVWMAHGGVHEDFIHALRERKLLDAVHIFAVTRRGTIRKK